MNFLILVSFYYIYRSSNCEPLMYLYQGESLTKEELKDESITKRLKLLGYNGIEELDDYYIDYFNKNYNTSISNLGELPKSYVEKIYNENTDTKVLETNKEIKDTFGRVDIYYIDTEGNLIVPKTTMQNIVDTEYFSSPLEISDYVLKSIKGNQSGIYTNGVQEVYYIYEKVDNILEVSSISREDESIKTSIEIILLPLLICCFSMLVMLKIIQYNH